MCLIPHTPGFFSYRYLTLRKLEKFRFFENFRDVFFFFAFHPKKPEEIPKKTNISCFLQQKMLE